MRIAVRLVVGLGFVLAIVGGGFTLLALVGVLQVLDRLERGRP